MSCKIYTIAENSKVLRQNIKTNGSMQDGPEAAQESLFYTLWSYLQNHKTSKKKKKKGGRILIPKQGIWVSYPWKCQLTVLSAVQQIILL